MSVSLRFGQGNNGCDIEEGEEEAVEKATKSGGGGGGEAAMNTTKHLWAGITAAMVSRFVVVLFIILFVHGMR